MMDFFLNRNKDFMLIFVWMYKWPCGVTDVTNIPFRVVCLK